jgi:hypothetical protein
MGAALLPMAAVAWGAYQPATINPCEGAGLLAPRRQRRASITPGRGPSSVRGGAVAGSAVEIALLESAPCRPRTSPEVRAEVVHPSIRVQIGAGLYR